MLQYVIFFALFFHSNAIHESLLSCLFYLKCFVICYLTAQLFFLNSMVHALLPRMPYASTVIDVFIAATIDLFIVLSAFF